jgi:hypothetical protein
MTMLTTASLLLSTTLLASAPAADPAAQDSVAPPNSGSASVMEGKAPYASATGLTRPPNVYVIPMDGQMGTDIHPSIYERILKDLKEAKPDLVVFRLNSNDGKFTVRWMDAVEAAMSNDQVDPRMIASEILEYRDMAAKLHNELRDIPCAMFVEDARGMSCIYALAWSYMYMAPTGWLQGLDVVGKLGGGNDADIRAKMFAAWTGIAKGVLELGGHPQELTEALVRPDRELSVDVEGRVTKWRADDAGSWYLVDDSLERPAFFNAKTAEDTGLAQGLATDVGDLMLLLGYPEYKVVGNGEKMFSDYKTAWRKRWDESLDWMREFQEPIRDASELGKRKQILEKMKSSFKQFPAMARLWQWKAGLTEAQLDLLIEDIVEKIKAAQKAKQQQRKGGGGGGGGRSFGSPN